MSDQSQGDQAPPIIRVLLVEDHSLTRLGLKAAFKRTSDIAIIGEAVNGEDAIAQAQSLSPDVILMDVGMPIMDGIQAARMIISKNMSSKIIMLTQHDNEEDIMSSLAAGASGYCLKDVEPERLYTAIRAVHGGDVWLDSAIAGRVLRLLPTTPRPAQPPYEGTDSETQQGARSSGTSTEATNTQALTGPLSDREMEVLKLIVDGFPNQQIAEKLMISLATVKTHVRNILNKLSVDDRTQAAVKAMRRGLV
ncbi:MAG: response regulator transcription factor [Candidatus Obscuribacterales bacterium]|nr:response regulator transcription factor [Candidatus Obscuribacterales bacterium]